MRRAILLVAVMAAAVLVGSAAVAYAQQPATPQDRAAQDKAAQQPATPQDKAAQDKGGTPPAPADQTTPATPSGGAANTAPPSPQNASGPQKASGSPVTSENHSWGGYHWARQNNPFTLKLGNNLSSNWPTYLNAAALDWNKANPLETSIVRGQSNARKCRATPGQDEVCDANYGQNGWLGLASIWLSGSHITQGTVKLNDTYFGQPPYNTDAWKQMVTCQEVAHTFGLDHQDETFGNTNLGTCMDYTNNPLGPPSNVDPNQHDYDELNTIYSHLDPSTTIGASTAGKVPPGNPNDDPSNEPGDSPGEWGREVSRSANGRASIYELDLPNNGGKKVTHVRWTEEEAAKHKKA
jgi:hypothetical protein